MSAQKPDVRRRAWFLSLARRYVRRRLRNGFDGLYVHGIEPIRRLAQTRPVVLAANHVCWWDAFVVVMLDEALGTESYCLMDADNLRQMPFFGWIGAVPLDRSSLRQGLRDLRASATLLDQPGRALWIFPQGEHRPPHLRPLQLKRGVEMLVRGREVDVVPVAINYVWRQAPQPTIAVSFGAPLTGAAGAALLGVLDEALVTGLSRIDRFTLSADEAGFSPLIAPRGEGRVPLGAKLLAAFKDRQATEAAR